MTRRFDTEEATLVREPGVDALAGVMPKLDDDPGPARRLSTTRSQRMVADILAAATAPAADAPGGDAPATDAPPPSVAAPPRRAPRKVIPLVAAALVAAAVVGAAAAVVTARLMRPTPAPTATPPPIEVPRLTAPAPVEAPPPTPPPPVTAPAPSPAPAPTATRPRARATDDGPAADLLAAANAARKDRDWRGADVLYRRVAARFAGTDAAVVAQVASATLHLEHLGDARGALAGYRRALAAQPRGDLDEEARWGVAEASRALGDRAGEQAALAAFVAAHPGAALAPAARRRLAALSSSP